MSLSNMKIGRKLTLSFAALILLLVTLSGIVIKSLGDMDFASFWNDHTYQVLEHANAVMSAMVNQETGLRGFLVSGDEKFLDPYKSGQEQFSRALDATKQLTSDNPVQQDRLDKIKSLAENWRSQVAEPEIKLARDVTTRDQARTMEASGAGKTSMDGIRSILHDVDNMERGLLTVRGAAQDAASKLARWSMIIGSAIAALMAILLGWMLTRTIANPVSAMATVMNKLAAGDNTVTIPSAGQKDEIGDMAGAVQSFKDAAIEKVRLEGGAVHVRQKADEERMRNEVIKVKAAEEQAQAVRRLGDGLKSLANGDLTIRLGEGFSESYAQIRDDFNEAIAKLKNTMLSVVSSTGTIQSGTREISTASDDLSRRTEQQAASLEETAAALDEITATVKKSAEGANHARQVVASADEDAKKSAVVVRQAVEAMDAIAKSAQQISQIIGVIDEIAFQTNLLALNAGVEAARAGDAGRGFAVVASEVRALAQRSAEAAKEIKGLISASTTQVDHGVKLVAETGKSLERIMAQVSEINTSIGEIAVGAHEQATGLEQINTAINQMDQMTQQNAAMVEESTAASHSLSQETSQLSGLIGQFQVGGRATGEDSMRRELQKAAPHAFRPLAKAPAPGARVEPRVVAAAKRPEAPKTARPARAANEAMAVNGSPAGRDAGSWDEF